MAALVCFLALSLGPAQFLPQVFALAAGIEGSHTVLIGSASDGGTEIVLRHALGEGSGSSRAGVAHRHGLASKLICLMADRPLAGGDHVATFAPSGAVENAQKDRRIQSRVAPSLQLDLAPATSDVPGSALQLVAFIGAPEARGTNLRSMSARQRCLRSTCLLI